MENDTFKSATIADIEAAGFRWPDDVEAIQSVSGLRITIRRFEELADRKPFSWVAKRTPAMDLVVIMKDGTWFERKKDDGVFGGGRMWVHKERMPIIDDVSDDKVVSLFSEPCEYGLKHTAERALKEKNWPVVYCLQASIREDKLCIEAKRRHFPPREPEVVSPVSGHLIGKEGKSWEIDSWNVAEDRLKEAAELLRKSLMRRLDAIRASVDNIGETVAVAVAMADMESADIAYVDGWPMFEGTGNATAEPTEQQP